ncbi:MAG: precorrin-6A reductase [Lachnospiraceae bacterium]|nr:precorrin-6A reductase [Lachnospiraceae bacterium]MBQ9606517.1 precorrin-6A reductase [Lachnospiraceae bacterium]MBR1523545.1 precorrin-6A reductase [Lachnospiraceae bacterium]
MSRILVFAGTTEGRKLAEKISLAGASALVCVATEYGAQVMPDLDGIEVRQGRLTESQMEELMESEDFVCVVDATHPYATIASDNIKAAADTTLMQYLRLKRETAANTDFTKPGVHYFDDNESCAIALEGTRGSVLLTIGSKELPIYTRRGSLKGRLVARILPGSESLKTCESLGLGGRDIIAMQGPFSKEMNVAQINDYNITVLVTKMSGQTGGFFEKALAADEAGISLFVVGNPDTTEGMSFDDVCSRLTRLTGLQIGRDRQFEVSVVGCGMGNEGNLTGDARNVIDDADYIFGSKRLVEIYGKNKQSFPFYKSDEIIQYLDRLSSSLADDTIKAAVLFSGDSGFYSETSNLIPALDEWKAEQKDRGTTVYIKQIPGISSIAALSAIMGITYENSKIISMHGVDQDAASDMTVVTTVRNNEKTFLLLSKPEDYIYYGKLLNEAGLGGTKLVMGVNMGSPDVTLFAKTAEDAAGMFDDFPEGLATMYIFNEEPLSTMGFALRDIDFIRREGIPMTKEEIRYVILGKLGLKKGEVFYDVGAGTGSISIAAAGISDDIHVYAIEEKGDIADLTEENKEKYGRDNVTVVKGTAPEIFDVLPKPDAAFIGGANGRMREIIRGLKDKGRDVRIVATAVTFETLNEIMEVMTEIPYSSVDIIQMNIAKTETIKQFHLIKALNPIFIACISFAPIQSEQPAKKHPAAYRQEPQPEYSD